jgi:hypothetical protein
MNKVIRERELLNPKLERNRCALGPRGTRYSNIGQGRGEGLGEKRQEWRTLAPASEVNKQPPLDYHSPRRFCN